MKREPCAHYFVTTIRHTPKPGAKTTTESRYCKLCGDKLPDRTIQIKPKVDKRKAPVKRRWLTGSWTHAYCHECRNVTQLHLAYMPPNKANTHPATDLVCVKCESIHATIHHKKNHERPRKPGGPKRCSHGRPIGKTCLKCDNNRVKRTQ